MKIKVDNKVITELTGMDKIYLKHYLPGNEGIERWLADVIIGNINRSKGEFIREWHLKLMADPNVISIPAAEEEFTNMVIARPDYKDRKKRDEEKT